MVQRRFAAPVARRHWQNRFFFGEPGDQSQVPHHHFYHCDTQPNRVLQPTSLSQKTGLVPSAPYRVVELCVKDPRREANNSMSPSCNGMLLGSFDRQGNETFGIVCSRAGQSTFNLCSPITCRQKCCFVPLGSKNELRYDRHSFSPLLPR
ncbi:hypothetical protein ARMSODRAFT_116160 [Armillaria solidipes]|uniref:Uncharacterized protein n=1 Tax=Armillaria solidipes TaxID=1076256 RepID=A0A2H3C309_9AGAR|nr:hypothetical protein ARMSODRAFT_116160 [Armillaria solidipes]